MRVGRLFLLFALFSFLILPATANAQNPSTGFPAFGSFQSTGFDAVNRQNLNANFVIPIVSIPARGQAFQYSLVNNSLLWTQTTVAPITWTPVTDANGNPTWGWNYGPAVSVSGQLLSQTTPHTCRYIDPDTGLPAFASWQLHSNFRYKDWLGTIHPFNVGYTVASPNATTYCGVQTTTASGYSTDNTGFFVYASQSSTYVLSPAGINASAAPVDTNGNYVSQTVVSSTETDWTDTAGHVALKVFNNGSNIQHEWQDSSGNYTAATTTTVLLTTLNIKTNFACSGVGEYTGTASLPTEIDLLNGQKYLITYEPTPGFAGYYTGRVRRVTLPTGGYYEYDYPTSAGDGIVCADSTVNSVTRIMNDGTNTSTWTFSRAPSGSNWVTTVTAPQLPYDAAGNMSLFTFNSSGQELTEQFYQGSANLLRTINRTWATNGTPATQITILEDGQTQNEVETSFDTKGNLLSLTEHDWGTGVPGFVVRTTTWTYLNTSPYTAANILNRVTRVTVADSGGTVRSRTDIAYDESGYINSSCPTGAPQHNDSNYGCSFTTRGNPTTVTIYTNAATPSGSIVKHTYYDSLGNVVKADMDCCQQKQWNYSATTAYSFPDSAVRGSSPGTQLTTSATYNPYTGLVATSTDENGKVTQYTYDTLKRLTNVQRPDLGNLTWSYTDAIPPAQSSVTATVPVLGTNVQKTTTTVDGLGRSIKQQITDAGSTSYAIVQTQYDPLGRPYMSSNPHKSTAQYWTTTQFDGLGRATKTILPDNSQTTFSYSLATVTVTDPAGKQKKSQADGLGRMTSVYEPDVTSGNSLTQQTSYAYNVLGLLTTVTQGAQTRTYSYDDLGRVSSAQTPETNQAATSFLYNNFGLVTQRTDARGVITTYGYDNLNRLTSVSYNVGSTGVPATASVGYTYDQGGAAANALGRLTSMTDGVGSETYSYDVLGQVTQLQKAVNGTTYTLGYQYNLAGQLTQVTYPSTRAVQQSYDAIGRLSAIASGATNYATSFGYNPAQQVTGFSYGNGVTASLGYSADRLQLTSLAYAIGGSTLFSLGYGYTQGQGNNGQITSITDNVDNGRSATYAYDALYRLTSAVTTGSANYAQWGLSFGYDRYGNRLSQSQTFGGPPTHFVTMNAATNRITTSGYAYDANGNMTQDGPSANTLVYDAENRLLSATNGGSSGSYSYDGNNLRVSKSSGGTSTVYLFSGTKVIAEYDNGAAPTSPSREYIYAGGSLLAKIEAGATKYYHPDHLSARVTTDSSGNIAGQQGHYPFGDSWYAQSTTTKWAFTSYEHDPESGNDYAMMRSYINRVGRFSSPDPLSGSLGDPQSLNRFSYALNDAVNFMDPLGLDPCFNPATGADLPCPDITSITVNGDPNGQTNRLSQYGAGAGGLSASETPLLYMRQHGGGGGSIDWAWWGTFFSEFAKGPSTGPGSCLAVFTNAMKEPVQQVRSFVQPANKYVLPALQSAQIVTTSWAGTLDSSMYTFKENWDRTVSAVLSPNAIVTLSLAQGAALANEAGASAVKAAPELLEVVS